MVTDSHPSDAQVQGGLDRRFSAVGGSASPPAVSGDVSCSAQFQYPGSFQTQPSFKQNCYKNIKSSKRWVFSLLAFFFLSALINIYYATNSVSKIR